MNPDCSGMPDPLKMRKCTGFITTKEKGLPAYGQPLSGWAEWAFDQFFTSTSFSRSTRSLWWIFTK
jgi:hypothetical protein